MPPKHYIYSFNELSINYSLVSLKKSYIVWCKIIALKSLLKLREDGKEQKF